MAAGYLTDVEYTGDFHDHLAPAWLAYIAAINGYSTPPLNSRFTWCELGCAKLMSSMFALHSGSFFGEAGVILMMLASLAMPLFPITGWMMYLDRRRKKSGRRRSRTTVPG